MFAIETASCGYKRNVCSEWTRLTMCGKQTHAWPMHYIVSKCFTLTPKLFKAKYA
mgnify:CR=1 FL=1